MDSSDSDLRTQQLAFAAYLRNPDQNAPPEGIEGRRLKIYRDLFLGNLSSLLGSSFPVLRKLYGNDAWGQLVRRFFAEYRCETPIFAEIPREFLTYLQSHYTPTETDPPFLLELAHYEWAEVALRFLDRPIPWESIDRGGDLLGNAPFVSPLAWSLAYRYPVHKISADFRPESPGEQPTRLLVYRDLADQLGFLEINVVTARLMELMEKNPDRRSGRELLREIATEMRHAKPETVIAGGQDILERLFRKDIVLGTHRH